MLWSFKALAIFSPDASRLLHGDSPPGVSSESRTLPPPNAHDITVTRPDSEHGRDLSQTWLCACGYQQLDFCPYCDYDQTRQVHEAFVPESSSHSLNFEGSIMSPIDYDFLNQPPSPRKRKLRKFRPHYQQLRYQTLDVEAVMSARPDSVLSTHSRTPLLNRSLPSNPNYTPLPSDRKTPKKLEKREKRKRSLSMSEPSSYFTSLPNVSERVVVRSKSFLQTKVQSSLGPRPKPVSSSIDTDALVSLAWTGEALSPIRSSDILFSESNGSSWSPSIESRPTSVIAVQEASLHLRPRLSTSNSSKRRSVLRKAKEADVQQPSRPWTLAMAIADDGLTDENFVDDLENMRIKGEPGGLPPPDPHPLGLCPPPFYQTQLLDSYAEYPLQPDELEQDSNSPLDSSWTSARQALLLCRELIRTERRYISSLKTLITNGTSSPPPPEMLPYLPGLITASEAFLELMEQNPSVQGVSEALLTLSGNLNDAFVSWCRVVGHFFDTEESGRSKSDAEDVVERSPMLRNPRSRATSMRTQTAESGLSVVISEPNKIRRNTKARPTPTQRIMRYVLLFKELHSLTPTTLPSFVLVEHALKIAQSIAQAANEAQGHAAFRQPDVQMAFVQPAARTA
ncbi:hypothetical protein M413DRAFT_439346 [Hebeloma cylindrosporum]|uniref:DH domain-containing protein n=1 Tax=Hebeloma cylindrosporum TaxID=76867 RepID=A0A0C3CG11_HEBCY|nr:hypothetical protein M413DRAFT_439346 [Hebeloma cylindrosporum h7]